MKEKDDVVDCMRYVELVRPFAPAFHDPTLERQRAKLDRLSRGAEDEFEALVKQATQPAQRGKVW